MSTSDQPHVSSLDETALASYQGVSIMAVLALLLGMASALALVHPFLWVVPPVAVVLSILAIRAIDAPDSNLTGRRLAIAGLALALLFGLWAPSRVLTRQWQLYRQARAFADDWLELIRQGELQAAHQLTLPHIERQKPGVSLEKIYSESDEAKNRYQNFFGDKPAKTIAALGDEATYEYAGGNGVARETFSEHVALSYRVRHAENGREREFPIRVVLDRQEGKEGRFYWLVRAVNDPTRATP